MHSRNEGSWLWLAGMLALMGFHTANAVEIKIASIAPDGSRWMQEMRSGAHQISADTGGRVELKFYPGGVMGNDAQVLRKVRIGQLQGGAFTAGGLAERYGGLNLYGTPLFFRSLDEVDYVRSRMDSLLQARLEEAGFVSFGFIEGGFANLMANHPIYGLNDLERRKVWLPEGDTISALAMQALGLSPVSLPITDVLPGLQTGLLDVVAASPVAALVLQWHTKVKYVTDLPVSYAMGIFAIDKRAFERLSAADQAVVRDVMTRIVVSLDHASRQDNIEARSALDSAGLEFVNVGEADVQQWRRTVEAVYPELRQRPDIDSAAFDQMIRLVSEYRSGAGSAP
jgi:TRAP-type C4-dicarboxylate transport system substrate-binding protein